MSLAFIYVCDANVRLQKDILIPMISISWEYCYSDMIAPREYCSKCGATVFGLVLSSGSAVRRYDSLGDDQCIICKFALCNTAHACSFNRAARPALSSAGRPADWARQCSARQMAINQQVLGDVDKHMAQWWETLFV